MAEISLSNDEKERLRHEAEGRINALLKPTLTCPVCSTKFSWVERRMSVHLKCPGCQTDLRVPRSYYPVVHWLDVAIVAVVSYIAGVHLLGFLLLLAITYLPMMGLLTWIGSHISPPRLRVEEDSPLDSPRLGE